MATRKKTKEAPQDNKQRRPLGVVAAASVAAAYLEAIGASAALVDGLAVGVRAEPRFTRAADLAVAVVSDAEAEDILFAMRQHGYVVKTIVEQARTARLATARLTHSDDDGDPAAPVYVDLLFASSGIEREIVESSQRLAIVQSEILPVARTGHLIALKVLSESDRRLQDRIDLQHLAAVATQDDWLLAHAAVSLIRERGYHRGRALRTRLRRWRQQ